MKEELQEDLQLWQSVVQEQNNASFDILYDRHKNDMTKLAFSLVKNWQTAEDITHEVFIAIWHQRATINIGPDVARYLFSAVKFVSSGYIKKAKAAAHHKLIPSKRQILASRLILKLRSIFISK